MGNLKQQPIREWPVLGYAIEKYTDAIHGLAVGEGDVRERLREIHNIIVFVSPAHVPDWHGVRADMSWILENMRRLSIARIQRRTGARIAERIFVVWCKLCSASRAGECQQLNGLKISE